MHLRRVLVFGFLQIFKDSMLLPHKSLKNITSPFYLEALCVCVALTHSLFPTGARIAVFADNINTMIQMFNSLAALPSLNWMLMVVVDAVLAKDISFHTLHVTRVHNMTTNLLSRFCNLKANRLEPRLPIRSFQPPQAMLGAPGYDPPHT